MSRHLEVTDRFKKLKKKHIDRLDALDTRMDKHETRSDEVFNKMDTAISFDEREMDDMEKDINDMVGNGGEENTDKVTQFPGTNQAVKIG